MIVAASATGPEGLACAAAAGTVVSGDITLSRAITLSPAAVALEGASAQEYKKSMTNRRILANFMVSVVSADKSGDKIAC
jgi:hypothetical protein